MSVRHRGVEKGIDMAKRSTETKLLASLAMATAALLSYPTTAATQSLTPGRRFRIPPGRRWAPGLRETFVPPGKRWAPGLRQPPGRREGFVPPGRRTEGFLPPGKRLRGEFIPPGKRMREEPFIPPGRRDDPFFDLELRDPQ
jgi:hypothetical protein